MDKAQDEDVEEQVAEKPDKSVKENEVADQPDEEVKVVEEKKIEHKEYIKKLLKEKAKKMASLKLTEALKLIKKKHHRKE